MATRLPRRLSLTSVRKADVDPHKSWLPSSGCCFICVRKEAGIWCLVSGQLKLRSSDISLFDPLPGFLLLPILVHLSNKEIGDDLPIKQHFKIVIYLLESSASLFPTSFGFSDIWTLGIMCLCIFFVSLLQVPCRSMQIQQGCPSLPDGEQRVVESSLFLFFLYSLRQMSQIPVILL